MANVVFDTINETGTQKARIQAVLDKAALAANRWWAPPIWYPGYGQVALPYISSVVANPTGANNSILFTSKMQQINAVFCGAMILRYVKPAAANQSLSVTANTGTGEIIVNLETNASAAAVTTANEVITAIRANANANSLVDCGLDLTDAANNGSGQVAAGNFNFVAKTSAQYEVINVDDLGPRGLMGRARISFDPSAGNYTGANLWDNLGTFDFPSNVLLEVDGGLKFHCRALQLFNIG